MSLVSLTFGGGGYSRRSPHITIETPFDRAQRRAAGIEAVVEVIKACKFRGAEGIYIVAKVTSGCVSNTMRGLMGEKTLEILDFESKYGSGAKEGMNCGISLSGAELEDFKAGDTVRFVDS